MNLPISNFLKRIALLSVVILTGISQGQDIGGTPLSAWIKIPSNPKAFKVTIHDSTANGNATMSLSGQRQLTLVDISILEKINLIYPPAILEALASIETQEFSRAEPLLRAASYAIIPFVSVPENNTAQILDKYEHALHQRNEMDLLRAFYSNLSLVHDPSYPLNATAWLAYLDTRESEMGMESEVFLDSGIQRTSGEIYFIQQMALCRNQMAASDYRKAVDHAARVVAMGTMEDALYPEALYISAQCYDGLAEQEQARLERIREEEVQKEFVLERVRVALELEAKADEEGSPPPSEQEILDSVDREAVESRVPPVPSVKENTFALIAQRLYLFNEQVFPTTYWGAAAGDAVWQETRENKESDLTNYIPPDIPN